MPSFVRPDRQWLRVLAFVERPTSNYKEQRRFICFKSLHILQIYFIFNLIILTENFIYSAWVWKGYAFSVVFIFPYFPFLSESWISTVEASWNLEHEIIFTHLTVLAAAISPLERSPAWFDNALALQSDAAAAMAAFRSVGAAEVFCLFVGLNGPITSGGTSARLVESVGAAAHSFSCMHRFALPRLSKVLTYSTNLAFSVRAAMVRCLSIRGTVQIWHRNTWPISGETSGSSFALQRNGTAHFMASSVNQTDPS